MVVLAVGLLVGLAVGLVVAFTAVFLVAAGADLAPPCCVNGTLLLHITIWHNWCGNNIRCLHLFFPADPPLLQNQN
ncbi:hypothetical protein NYE24_22840 [Paenibacillus sp. FSL H7-0350]|uniref:hypothetical protein n=1 Tax=Paenibacillus sp. FSL H7-0350 TaxID=2975345 RepID=UPI003158B439